MADDFGGGTGRRAHRHFFLVVVLVIAMACLFAALLSLSGAGPAG